jgi:hypothetical protein
MTVSSMARYRTYSEGYWDRRVMSPGSVLWYLGLNRKVTPAHKHLPFQSSPSLYSVSRTLTRAKSLSGALRLLPHPNPSLSWPYHGLHR